MGSGIISRSRCLARSRGRPHVTKPTLTAGVDKLDSVGGICEVERRVPYSSRVASARNGGFTVESRGTSKDTRWALGWLAGVVVGASALLVVLVGPLHIATGGTGHVAAVLAFVGVLVTAAASIIGLTVSRQSSNPAVLPKTV